MDSFPQTDNSHEYNGIWKLRVLIATVYMQY